jgi:2-amino-4-hydroxy-6-hydroxymethyldihydropteridine diphosphokinase
MEAFIGLGSNLGSRRTHLRAALEGLARSGLRPDAVSSVWETEPIGTDLGGWFLNMAVRVPSGLHPLVILERLQELERAAGRQRREPNGPRTLDLDLLLVGDLIIDHPRLRLPHPEMWRRSFVLEPLAEIAPELTNPQSGLTVEETRVRLELPGRVRRIGTLD